MILLAPSKTGEEQSDRTPISIYATDDRTPLSPIRVFNPIPFTDRLSDIVFPLNPPYKDYAKQLSGACTAHFNLYRGRPESRRGWLLRVCVIVTVATQFY